MPSRETEPVHLRRIDPARNMRRFYSLTVQPTLFGGASLIRYWGRIGTRGQTMMETFDTPDDAGLALDRLERSKRRRGYRVLYRRLFDRWFPGLFRTVDGQISRIAGSFRWSWRGVGRPSARQAASLLLRCAPALRVTRRRPPD